MAACGQGEGGCIEELNIYSSCMHTLRILNMTHTPIKRGGGGTCECPPDWSYR